MDFSRDHISDLDKSTSDRKVEEKRIRVGITENGKTLRKTADIDNSF